MKPADCKLWLPFPEVIHAIVSGRILILPAETITRWITPGDHGERNFHRAIPMRHTWQLLRVGFYG